MVGLDGLEPSTSRLSGVRSNHLSYKPMFSILFSYELKLDIFNVLMDDIGTNLSAYSLITTKQFNQYYFVALHKFLVEINGIEPLTPCLQSRCSPS